VGFWHNKTKKKLLQPLNEQLVETTFVDYDSKKSPITPSKTRYEACFGEPLFRLFVLTFDFEAMLIPNNEMEHAPIAFMLKSNNDKLFPPFKYCGTDCGKVFIETLEKFEEKIGKFLTKELNKKFGKILQKLIPFQQKLVYEEFTSIPILGFNSNKYDIAFIIKHMLK
jgi:hypothetical protein